MSLYSDPFLSDLERRGLVYDVTPELPTALAAGPLTGYIGFDPTAASLHVGSLLPILCLARLQRAGHHPIAIAGGGTGLIGDPSGKTTERQLLTIERVEENLVGIRRQLEHFLDFEAKANPARVINNHDWLGQLDLLGFLRDVGKYFKVNVMLKRESVERRLESEEGLSYTEFSYQLLQAYDFLELYDRTGCTLQMGGSDQWGNIVAGIDLIGRRRGARAHGLVFPLVTTASGTKFGKTEAGAVWLDPNLTSPYAYYQFWYNTEDKDALRYLRYFTFLGNDAIDELAAAQTTAPEKREAQRVLAEEVTRLTHGVDALERAQRISRLLFGEEVALLSADEVLAGVGDVPTGQLSRESLAAPGADLFDVLVAAGMASSKGEARRLVEGGGVYLTNRRITDPRRKVEMADTIEGRLLLLRKGRRDYFLVRLL
ncbi:MAG: tyrosine--tRNA ligase [Thermoanaerobaculia bacterium]|nr:tyrosine--tRNA ligase [Thermoanaerobaculia bacterium]